MTNFGSLATDNGLAIFYNGKMWNVANDHQNFENILEAINNKNYDSLEGLIDVAQIVSRWFVDHLDAEVRDGIIWINGRAVAERVSQKVLDMIAAGNPADPLIRFLDKLNSNPSFSAQQELLLFLHANNFMIHEDGDILAYKGVRSDYTDIHTGTESNVVGATLSMERNLVNDNRNETCSRGYHFAAHEYASTWSSSIGHLMILKIHPADVVSIPYDYDNQKGRCCRYTVIGEIPISTPLPHREVYSDTDLRKETRHFWIPEEHARDLSVGEDSGDVCDCDNCGGFDEPPFDCSECEDNPFSCDCGEYCTECGESR